ncbi:uncharacterized protein LOC144440929 isoform X2 [Glandiceps talaboti]
MSDHSKQDLTARLRQESSSRKQADELIDQLQQDYDDLLQKYALAEVTIDSLRLGAKINLESSAPQPGQSTTGTVSKAQQPQTISMGQMGHARLSPAPQQAMMSDTAGRGDPLSTSITTVNSIGSTKTPGDMDEIDPVLAAVTSADSMAMGLRFQAKSLEEHMETFQKLMTESHLSQEDEKQLFDRLKAQHEQLERDYLQAKEEQNTIRRRNNLISDTNEEGFDPDKEIEGEIFQLGMKLEDIQEKIQDSLRSQPSDIIGKNDALLASVDPELGRRKQFLTQQYNGLLDRYEQLKHMDYTPERDQEIEELMQELRNLHNENPDIFGHELPDQIEQDQAYSYTGSGVLPDRFFSASNPSLYTGHEDSTLYSPTSVPGMLSQGDPHYQSSDSLQGSPDSTPEMERRASSGYGPSHLQRWSGQASPSPSSSPEMVRKSQQSLRPGDSGRSTPSLARHSQATQGEGQKYPGQRPMEGDVDSGFVGSEGSRYSNQSSVLGGYGRLGKDRPSYLYSNPSPISQRPSSVYSQQSSASTVRGQRPSVTSQSHRWTESEDDMSFTNGRSVQSYDTYAGSSKRATPVKTRKSPASSVDTVRQRRPLSGRSRESNASTRLNYYTTEDEETRQDALKQRILRDKEAERWADSTNQLDKFDTASVVSRSSVKSEAIRALHDEVQKLKKEMDAAKRVEDRAKHPPLLEEMQAKVYEMPSFERPVYERERATSTPYGLNRSGQERDSPGYGRTQSMQDISRNQQPTSPEQSRYKKSPQGYSRQLFGSGRDLGQRPGVENSRPKYDSQRLRYQSGRNMQNKERPVYGTGSSSYDRGQSISSYDRGQSASSYDRGQSTSSYDRGRSGNDRGRTNYTGQKNSASRAKPSRREEMLRALRNDVQHLREQILKKYNPKYRQGMTSTPYAGVPMRGDPYRVPRSPSPVRASSPIRQQQPRAYPSSSYIDEIPDYNRSYGGRDPYLGNSYMDERPYTAHDSPYVDVYRSPGSPVGRPLSPRQRSMSMPSFNFTTSPCPLCGGTGSHDHGQYTYPDDYGREQQQQPPPQASFGPPPGTYSRPQTPMAPQFAAAPMQPTSQVGGVRMAQSVPSIPTAVAATPVYQTQPQAPTPAGSQYILTQPAGGATIQTAAQPSQQGPIHIISRTPVRQYNSKTKKGKVKYYTMDDGDTATEEEIIYRRTSPRRENRRRTRSSHDEDRSAKVCYMTLILDKAKHAAYVK